jgi:osmotically-inducible protein OsmY
METRKSNKQLQVDIREELGRVPSVDANAIGITADRGLVFLSGHVLGESWREATVKATLRVEGVHALVDEIKVRTSLSCAHDANLACEATAALRESIAVKGGRVRVIVRDGRVWLNGNPSAAAEKQAILTSFRDVLAAQGLKMDVEFLSWRDDGSTTPDPAPDRLLLPA